MILTIVLFLILVFLLYYGYRVVTDTKLIPYWVYFWKTKKSDTEGDTGSITLPSPDNTAGGLCKFEGEDLFTKAVYSFDGKNLPVDVPPILCSRCNQFIFKDDEGCTPYLFDKDENSIICDPKQPGKYCTAQTGVCTVSLAPSKKCPF